MNATEAIGSLWQLVSNTSAGDPPAPVPARMTTALRCPASGPQDVRVYLTLAEFERAAGGALTNDGRVFLLDERGGPLSEIDLAVLDTLENQGWVELADGQTMRMTVTQKGRFWLAKFLKANRLEIR